MTYARFRKRLAQALEPQFHPIEYLDGLLERGEAIAFANDDAILICELLNYPGGARVINVLIAAGKKADIIGSLREQAEEWARGVGCTHALVESRAGWAKALKQFGYEPYQVTVRKEL